jgi:peptidoglycan-associated lipoprotein
MAQPPSTAQPPATAAQPPSTGTQTTTPGPGARPSPKEFVAIADLKDVFFDFDKYDIRPEDAKTLDGNAGWLKSNPNHLVLIEGHCDERGTNEYNLALGERRAKATMNYLVSQGVQASRITIISYGEERPTCTEKTEACWAKNRRAHFLVKPR